MLWKYGDEIQIAHCSSTNCTLEPDVSSAKYEVSNDGFSRGILTIKEYKGSSDNNVYWCTATTSEGHRGKQLTSISPSYHRVRYELLYTDIQVCMMCIWQASTYTYTLEALRPIFFFFFYLKNSFGIFDVVTRGHYHQCTRLLSFWADKAKQTKQRKIVPPLPSHPLTVSRLCVLLIR